MAAHLILSRKELERKDTLDAVVRGELTIDEASLVLGLCRRQTSRILTAYRKMGIEGLISRKRGKPSNNRLPGSTIDRAIEIYRVELNGYGPTQASEVLADEHGIQISRETLRKALIARQLWLAHLTPAERRKIHQPRTRRECVGELIQIDGSTHEWLPDQPPCCLYVFIDDATGRLMHLHLEGSETDMGFLRGWMSYLQDHGRPLAVYGDRGGAIFRLRKPSPTLGSEFTSQHARALNELGIAVQPAFSAEARGRVERAHRTLQDRLTKFLRRRRARSISEVNALLADYMADHNGRFAKHPSSDEDRHRPLSEVHDLDAILSIQRDRKLSRKLTLSFNRRRLVLLDCPEARAAIGHRVVVHDNIDGTTTVRHDGQVLEHWLLKDASSPSARPADKEPEQGVLHRGRKRLVTKPRVA